MTTTEMVSAKGLYYKNEKTEHMLKISDREHPVSIQLFGSDPDIMALGAREGGKGRGGCGGHRIWDVLWQKIVRKLGRRIRTDEECESGGRYCQSYGKGRFQYLVTGKGMRIGWDGRIH